jgi:thiol-disulfide isomerase/thioredoxin
MRRIPWLLPAAVLAFAASAGHAGDKDWASWEPKLARHLLRDLDGGTVTLKEMRGDVVIVNFWASWCKPCKKELLSLDEWNQSLDGKNARIVAVSIDRDRKNAVRFIESSGLTLPVYHDGPEGLAEVLDLPSLPCTVVLDAWGKVVRVEGGGTKETIQNLQGSVNSLLKNDPQRFRAALEVSG